MSPRTSRTARAPCPYEFASDLVHVRPVTRRSGRCAARNKSFAACSTSLAPRRLLTSALAFVSEHRSERNFSAASKSSASPFSAHSSFGLLTVGFLSFRIFLEDALKFFLRIEYLRWHYTDWFAGSSRPSSISAQVPIGTSLSGRILFALDAGQFLRLQVQPDGGSEHGFGRRLLRSPRGLRLCAKSDRLS